MSTTTTRTGDEGQNFQQTTMGETPNSVEVSLNAKGQAQVSIKLYYGSPIEMASLAPAYLSAILKDVRASLASQGITLAGQEGK